MFITSRLIPLAANTPSKGTWQFFSHASPNQGIDLNAMGEVVVGRDAKVSEETGENKQWNASGINFLQGVFSPGLNFISP